jgi:hypothetical protein
MRNSCDVQGISGRVACSALVHASMVHIKGDTTEGTSIFRSGNIVIDGGLISLSGLPFLYQE